MKVSVITPTWQRHELLMGRCVPSVRGQLFDGEIEHIVISDGPDPALADALADFPGLRYVEWPEHPGWSPNFGSHLRNHALTLATGDVVMYLDDDNAYRPDHVARLVVALDGVDFAYSRMQRHGHVDGVIGTEPPGTGNVDTSILSHRSDLPTHWPQPEDPCCDAVVVAGWLAAGARWRHVPEVTVDYYWRGGQ